MKYFDIINQYQKVKPVLSAFSSYTYDPVFFERQIFRRTKIGHSGKTLILVDASQYWKLLQEIPSVSFWGSGYLVIPISPKKGVFHPKLQVVIGEGEGYVLCGSNNVTHPGTAHNLELVNCIPINYSELSNSDSGLACLRQILEYFKLSLQYAPESLAAIAKKWLDDALGLIPQNTNKPGIRLSKYRLLLGGTESIWTQLIDVVENDTPECIVGISPFYDRDARFLKKIATTWPQAKVRLIVQQEYTCLPVEQLAAMSFMKNVSLRELKNTKGRRLHAKLLAFQFKKKRNLIVTGSANLTSAAFEGKNFEACLLFESDEPVENLLFDSDLATEVIAIEEFVSGPSEEEDRNFKENDSISIESAIFGQSDQLVIQLSQPLTNCEEIKFKIRNTLDSEPLCIISLTTSELTQRVISVKREIVKQVHNAAVCVIEYTRESVRRSTPWCPIVQQEKLIQEQSSGSSGEAIETIIRERGYGLAQYLERLHMSEGNAAVIEFLNRLNIKYVSSGSEFAIPRGQAFAIRDPFKTDQHANWVFKGGSEEADKISNAIYEFVDRHQKRILKRHSKGGNINGLENFIDVFRTINGLLFKYNQMGIVPNERVVGYITDNINILTEGYEREHDYSYGYIEELWSNYEGDDKYFYSEFNKHLVLEHIYAAFYLAQICRARYSDGDRPKDVMKGILIKIELYLKDAGFQIPTWKTIGKAYLEYDSFVSDDIAEIKSQMDLQ